MKTFVFLATMTLFCWQTRGAVGVFLPAEGVNNEGNVSLGAPFDTDFSSRLQQVYEFSRLAPGSAYLISGIYFRIDVNGRVFDEILPSVQVNLSTTDRGPDGLSAMFSDNIGADETIVHGLGPLHLSGLQPGFAVGITFDQPYLYNPAAGNLLLDIRNFGPAHTSILDAFAVLGDSVSIVGNENVNSPLGATLTHGLATEFWVDIVPVPEPGTITLLLLGALALAWKLRRPLKSLSTQD